MIGRRSNPRVHGAEAAFDVGSEDESLHIPIWEITREGSAQQMLILQCAPTVALREGGAPGLRQFQASLACLCRDAGRQD